ncbi:MAG: cob(I)yrinic acid a,c-diamide adenosyltransferase [Betaproteobacteria bacterium]|nr:cob(I)yrinic acid a,c-diamide adenosyltransferase [Betaproteobacteria bacterium]
MGHRLTKITTRTGDDGTTGLADGSRLDKDHPRIQALGEVDELNSQIGLLRADLQERQQDAQIQADSSSLGSIEDCLAVIQHDLFDLGGSLCLPGQSILTEDRLTQLDAWIEAFNADLPPLKDFVLPGGSRVVAQAHVARTVARRAERCVVSLKAAEPDREDALDDLPRLYLNRLSDLLFILSRSLARRLGEAEVVWRRSALRQSAGPSSS